MKSAFVVTMTIAHLMKKENVKNGRYAKETETAWPRN